MTAQEIIQELKIPAGYKKPTIEVPDGNAFSIFAAVKKAVRQEDKGLAARYSATTAKSDSYDTVLTVASTLVNFGFPI